MKILRRERIRRGWSQTELAAMAKMSMPDISRLENGRMTPYGPMARRLAEALNIPEDDLIKEA